MDVYLEVGQRRTFAVALDWPGWARSGRDGASALRALLDYADRYRRVVANAPKLAGEADMNVIERLPGDSTTDFGAPGAIPSADWQPVPDAELERLIRMLQAAWRAFDEAANSTRGRELATGPRGGGRNVEKMREHVAEADASYTRALGARPSEASWTETQSGFIDAVWARARGEIPDAGPRGGKRWPARHAIRRSAWHALDHAWEIEDRLAGHR